METCLTILKRLLAKAKNGEPFDSKDENAIPHVISYFESLDRMYEDDQRRHGRG